MMKRSWICREIRQRSKSEIANPNGDETWKQTPVFRFWRNEISEYDGMDADACKSKIITDLEAKDAGRER